MIPEPHWIATPSLRLDHRGPVDRPYIPFVDPALATPLLALLQAVAIRQPNHVALEDPHAQLTIGALLQAVERVRAEVERAQPAPGRVGILLPPSVDYGVALLAVLAAGRTSVLLDASYPETRNAAIAAATGTSLVITSAARTVRWAGTETLAVQSFAGGSATAGGIAAERMRPAALGLDEPAFILPTSGSSGAPKPIVHSQRTMLHWARVTHDALHVTASDRALSLSSPSSLGGLTGLIGFLLGGATVHLLDIRMVGMGGLLDALAAHPVTILRAGPSLLRSLAALPEARDAFAGLRAVQTYGEPLMKADVAALSDVLPSRCLIRTTYGSTEASGFSWFAGAGDDYDPHRVATGVLLPDTIAAIVDDEGHSCPPGEPGELVIRSRYNALGEWTDGQLGQDRLHPHHSADGTRVFHTGDVARYHPDGVFVVLGRKDRMVKINGQRLEPAEVEAVLRRVRGVERGEVVVQPAVEGVTSPRLVAFIVPAAEGPDDLVKRTDAELRAALPAFMWPYRIISVPAIPLLPGGKVDGRALLATATALRGPRDSRS